MHPGPLGWLAFAALVAALLALDVFVLHRGRRAIPVQRAIVDTAAWTAAGAAFAIPIAIVGSGEAASEYLSAFALEKTLSLDNVAVFAVVIAAFGIPSHRRHGLLTQGVLASLWLRIGFIVGGLALLHWLHPVIYVFGAVLVFTGIRMLLKRDGEAADPGLPRWLGRLLPMAPSTSDDHGYLLRAADGDGRRRWYVTPLLAALVAIALADVVFAVDSVPAAFAVTRDAFLIVAATAFSVLGLRPLYFVLAGALDRFRYLRPALGVVLVAIGAKTVLEDVYDVPTWTTLAVVVGTLGTGVILSVVSRTSVQTAWSRLPRPARQATVAVFALPLVLAGLAMLVLPGPGLPVLAAGLALLAIEFAWARSLLDAVRRRWHDVIARARRRASGEAPSREGT